MSRVYDSTTGQMVDDGGAGAQRVAVFDPGGKETTVAGSDLEHFLKAGFRLDTPELRADMARQREFGDTTGEMAAGALGGARALTFGLSDLALSKTGILTPEQLRAYKEVNPDATMVGEFGSMALPLAGSLGLAGRVAEGLAGAGKAAKVASGLDAAAEAAGAGFTAVSKAGQLVEHGVGALAGQTVGRAAGTAAEFEAYNIANNLSEAVLGDQDLTAERLLAHSGHALAFGAGLGLALPSAGRAIQAAAEKASGALDSLGTIVREKVAPAIGRAVEEPLAAAASSITGAPKDVLLDTVKGFGTEEGLAMREKLLKGITPESRNALSEEVAGNITQSVEAMQGAVNKAYRDIRPKEIESALSDVPADGAWDGATKLLEEMRGVVKTMREQPDKFTAKNLISNLEEASNGFEKRLGEMNVKNAGEVFGMVNDTKRLLDKQVSKWRKNISPEFVDTIDATRGVRDLFKSHLEDATIYGEAGTRQQAFNEAFSTWKRAEESLMQVFGQKIGGKTQIVSTKVDTFMRQVGAAGGKTRNNVLQEFMDASRSLVEQIGESQAKAGVESVDRAGLQSLIEKSLKSRSEAEAKLADLNKLRGLDPFISVSPVASAVTAGIAATGFVPGAAAAQFIMSKLSNPTTTVRTLAAIEGFTLHTTKRITKAVDGFVKRAGEAGKSADRASRAFQAPSSVRATRDKHVGERGEAVLDDRQRAFKTRVAQISQLVTSPDQGGRQIDEGLHRMSAAAPALKSAVMMKQLSNAQFLYDKAPKNPSAGKTLNPLIENWKPSDSAIAKWERYYSAVQDPLSVVDDLNAGHMSREGVEALKACYPALYSDVQQQFLSKISTLQKQLPYRDRLQLSTLLEIPADASMDPSFVASMQSMYSQQQSGPPQGPQSYRPSAAAAKIAQSEGTPSQRISER